MATDKVTTDIQNLVGLQTDNKAFLAFEKRSTSGDTSGIYFLEFDRNSEGTIDPDTIYDTAKKIIDRSIYTEDINRIQLYATDDGSDITISFITAFVGGNRKMFTGRIVNGEYVACDLGEPTDIPANNLGGWFAFYFHNKQKLKFYQYRDPSLGEVAGAQIH